MNSEPLRVTLLPAGNRLEAAPGAPLRDLLLDHGVEFPCGGQGRCRGCRVKVVVGEIPADAAQTHVLSADEIAAGWRLACRSVVTADLTLELRQWDLAILGDQGHFAFSPQEGCGIAVDVGTTTLVAQLLDLRTGTVCAVTSCVNPQARWGADVMSRVHHAVTVGADELTGLIRRRINGLVSDLLQAAQIDPVTLTRIVLVGNTVMHHLFCGIDPEPLSHAPFTPVDCGLKRFSAGELGWDAAPERVSVDFLPVIGGFVGSDVLAGIVAVGMAESETVRCLIDLGTNGEIVIGNRYGMVCASAAAGPAFEGARISCGMRASSGAICQVDSDQGALVCRTLGGGVAHGVCGSGLVDAAAAALDLGWLLISGRIRSADRLLPLTDGIVLTQSDIRQLQLAKAAVAAGVRLLARAFGAELSDIAQIDVAGAFGNYVRITSAQRIGLLPFPIDRVQAAGNTALLGAKRALFARDRDYSSLRRLVRHIDLNCDPVFQEMFVEEMTFPNREG